MSRVGVYVERMEIFLKVVFIMAIQLIHPIVLIVIIIVIIAFKNQLGIRLFSPPSLPVSEALCGLYCGTLCAIITSCPLCACTSAPVRNAWL